MTRLLAFISLLAIHCGCSKTEATQVATESLRVAPRSDTDKRKVIEFAGRTWRYTGPTSDEGRPYNDSFEYLSDEPGVRVVEGVPSPAYAERARALRMLRVQRFVGGRWIDDGPDTSWDRDGSRMEGNKRLGKFEGLQRGWWPNGQLHVERIYSNDERRVEGKGWYRNGAKQYESVTVDGTEISGRAWTEGGILVE